MAETDAVAITPQIRAERSARAMWDRDDASRWMGLEIVTVGPGTAEIALSVVRHHTNGHDICHGGVIFTLADSAFAFACNSYNRIAVAQHNAISYIAPAHLGDRLTATAREISLRGRSGLYDVRVTDDGGTLIAEFRGASRILSGSHFPETPEDRP